MARKIDVKVSDPELEAELRGATSELAKREAEEGGMRRIFPPQGEDLAPVTDLKRDELEKFGFAFWYARRYHQPWLEDLLWYNLDLRISVKRKGRDEFIKGYVGSIEQKARTFLRLRKREG